jgi:type II secretory pathway pseudopilin PulG
MRTGFTMLEALVALVLFQVGIFALVASSAVITRDVASAHRRARAQAVAAERVERLRASSCPTPGTGRADLPGGTREHWRVEATGRARLISDSVDYALPATRRGHAVVRAWVICRS